MRTWGARLRRRWIEVTGEECNLPKTLKECQRLHHDLLQADDESFENVHASAPSTKPEQHPTQQNEDQRVEDPEAGPGPATQANRKKKRKIVVPITALDIHFEECPVGRDLERPHQNRSLMSKWVGIVPHPEENPAYAFKVV